MTVSLKVALTVIDGPDKGVSHQFSSGQVTLGRAKGDVILTDKKISSKHCTFSIEGSTLFIEDHHSTNGTFLAGRKIDQKETIQNLDEVIVGLSRISVSIVDELQEFKKKNTASQSGEVQVDEGLDLDILDDESEAPSELSMPTRRSEAPKPAPAPVTTDELPPADAVYRETGIQRIENLIADELDTFSKWDHPSVQEKSEKPTGSLPKIKVTLTVRRGPEGTTNFTCTKPVTSMGRKDVDMRLNDRDCSRRHATVEIVGSDKAFVRDLASTNGTYVNGKRVAYQEIKNGDLVQVGQTIFEINIAGAKDSSKT